MTVIHSGRVLKLAGCVFVYSELCLSASEPTAQVMPGRGTVWYRLVGIDLTEMNHATAAIEASVRGVLQPHRLVPVFGAFVQVDVSNASADSGVVALANSAQPG